LAKRVEQFGTKVMVARTDVTSKSDVDSLVTNTLDEYGQIDILVNNAGICKAPLYLLEIEEEEWDRTNEVNAKGVYLVTKAVAPHMIAARHGKIVNMASVGGKEGYAGFCHYNASKFAVLGFTQAIAKELAEYDINVNAVCPGIV